MKTSTSKYSLALILAFISCFSFCLGCSSGKDKLEPAPGLTMEEPGTNVRLKIVVDDNYGKHVANLNVVAHSGKSSVKAITGDDGMVVIGLKEISPSGVDFTFSGEQISWTERVSEIPEEILSATLYFTVDQLGQVRFSRLHY